MAIKNNNSRYLSAYGFNLLEMILALGIGAVLIAGFIPLMTRWYKQARFKSELMQDIARLHDLVHAAERYAAFCSITQGNVSINTLQTKRFFHPKQDTFHTLTLQGPIKILKLSATKTNIVVTLSISTTADPIAQQIYTAYYKTICKGASPPCTLTKKINVYYPTYQTNSILNNDFHNILTAKIDPNTRRGLTNARCT